MNQIVIIEYINSLDELTKLLEENQKILDLIYSKDIFIKTTISKLNEKFPDLWKLYNILNGELQWLAKLIGAEISHDSIEINNPYINSDNIVEKKQYKPSCKNIFRKICRLTHPDKIKNKKLNDQFILAKKLYEKGDLQGLQDLYDDIINDYNEESLAKRMSKIENEILDNKRTLTSLEISEDYVIAVKYQNQETRTEAELLFRNRLNSINDNLFLQINQIKSKILGV